MFIKGIRFINTISRHVKFMTAEHINNAEASTQKESIRQVKKVYMLRGFKVANILIDGQFTCIRGNLAEIKINLNISSNEEDVGEIERLNCTRKERVRGIYNKLTFNKIPVHIIVELVALVIFWINVLPPSKFAGGNL